MAPSQATNSELEISGVASGALSPQNFGGLLERSLADVTTRQRGGRQEEIRLCAHSLNLGRSLCWQFSQGSIERLGRSIQ